jgi:hypothetical protein
VRDINSDCIGERATAIYKGKPLAGKIIDVYYNRVEIYPDGETGPPDEVAFVFNKDDVTLLNN